MLAKKWEGRMRYSFTFYHEVEDIYTPEDLIEVEVEVEFDAQPPEPDVGIMSSHPEDICVISTDCALFGVDDAERFLDGGSKEAKRIIEQIGERCNDDLRDYDH